jgi:hypothetical protein
MSKYPEQCLLDLFHLIKNGVPWKKITKMLNKKFKLYQESKDYRNLYHRNKEKFDLNENEKLTIDMIREAAAAKNGRTKSNKKLNAVMKEWDIKDHLLDDFEKVTKKLTGNRTVIKKAKKNTLCSTKTSMTMALDISDIHGGLKTKFYDYNKIRLRLEKLVEVFMEEYDRNSKTHNVEDIVIGLNGDMIHNEKLHEDSIKACEESTPGQLFNVTEIIFETVIEPLGLMGLPVRVVATAGNHDRTCKGRAMFQQGKEGFTWTIYKTLEMLCKKLRYDNIEFIIPEGYGCVIEIQGSNILYEHGDMIKGSTENILRTHLNKRSEQFQMMLHGLRIGHFHSFRQFGRKIIVNGGLVCGDDFSDSSGYAAEPVQTIVTYCKSPNRKNSLYKVFPVILPK